MRRFVSIILLAFLSFSGFIAAKSLPIGILETPTNAKSFWEWFSKNSDAYYTFENNQEALFDALAAELIKIDENLTFEFGPVLASGKREFIISANGIRSSFPAVTDLVKKAPTLSKWVVIAFRPRKGADFNVLEYERIQVKDSDVFFKYSDSEKKLGLQIFILDYEDNLQWKGLAYVMLDQIIGEYDTEMEIGFLEFKPLEEDDRYILLPISKLPEIVDAHKQKR